MGMLGRKHSEETKLKMRLASLGRPKSLSARRKMSERMRLEWSQGTAPGFKKGHKNYLTQESRLKISQTLMGENNYAWKGDRVGYRVLHLWVTHRRGKPSTCEHCGKSDLSGRQIHWANKSHEYKRELSDWIRLCAKCHKQYDRKATI